MSIILEPAHLLGGTYVVKTRLRAIICKAELSSSFKIRTPSSGVKIYFLTKQPVS